MDKYFIITVDTEGDNLWRPVIQPKGMRNITVKNAAFIERFQLLCEKYQCKPTYLVNYEMSQAEPFVEQAKEWLKSGTCEIGMHMHAWSTPPLYDLKYKRGSNNPYAGDYPREVMWEKLKNITYFITDQFGVRPISHRGGRWFIDAWYMKALKKLKYKVDCSVTPGVSWKEHIGYSQYGVDYRNFPHEPYFIEGNCLYKKGKSGILEVPPTITNLSWGHKIRKLMQSPYNYKNIRLEKAWLRPNGSNLETMLWIIDKYNKSNCNYLEFMIHSSELMPGGSPTFMTDSSIEKAYRDMEIIFEKIRKNYIGITLGKYAEKKYLL